jgi:hypothetical protein
MTRSEVEAILASPSREESGGIMSHVFCFWEEGENVILVEFLPDGPSGPIVYKKWAHPETWWEKLQNFVRRSTSKSW